MKHNHLSLSILAAGLLFGACKKQLNVFPTTAIADGNLITDQVSAQQVLNGVYFKFAAASGTTTQWVFLNESYPSELSGAIQFSAGANFFNHNITPSDGNSASLWKYGYDLVDAANGCIENLTPVTAVTASVKQQMLAEARFLRAFGNSELLLYFGQYNDPASPYGIILREKSANVADIKLPRSGVSAAYTSILADLDAAIGGLPALNSAIYYVNASTARLLKARVLMNRGAAGDYAQVIGLTSDIIGKGPFVLEDSLKDIFLTKGFNSKEVMLGIQPYSGETTKYSAYVGTRNRVTGSLPDLLADDARNQWVYKIVPYSSTVKDYRLMKYYSGDPVNVKQTSLCTYSYAFRLSEAYLLQAEAITMSGGDL
ncbi:MAG TPA: RagB/SusD family nutrient uptake outer membrane protein, partial [Puia sp.]